MHRVETKVDKVEKFIETHLRKNASNLSTRSSVSDVKISNEHICVPIYGVQTFPQRVFKRQFPDALGVVNVNAVYWIVFSRE